MRTAYVLEEKPDGFIVTVLRGGKVASSKHAPNFDDAQTYAKEDWEAQQNGAECPAQAA